MNRVDISNEENSSEIFKPAENIPIENKKRNPREEKNKPNQSKEEEKEDMSNLKEKLSKQYYIAKIKKWKTMFPEILKPMRINYEKKSVKQLMEFEKQLEYSVAMANSGSIIQSSVLGTAGIIEKFSTKYGVNLNGYQKVLLTNGNFVNILKELECKYSGDMQQNIWARLTSTMVYSATLLHFHNTNQIKEILKKEKVNKKMEEKYKDI